MMTLDPEQIRLMEEDLILVNLQDKETGSRSKKDCHLNENLPALLHRAFSVFLFNNNNELLLQQRSVEKITFPSCWTNTCCSHPCYLKLIVVYNAQERDGILGVLKAAQRKLDHELGIKIDLSDPKFLTRIHYYSPSDSTWGEHEIDYCLVIKGDFEYDLNYNEVLGVKYVTSNELRSMMSESTMGELQVTPWFKLIVEEFLYKWWDNLDNLDQFIDGKIHSL